MKLLIAYDGSKCSEAALDDLARAGLPDSGEAVLISVAELWNPHPGIDGLAFGGNYQIGGEPPVSFALKAAPITQCGSEAGILASHAEKRLRQMFPNWQTSIETAYGSPATEILRCAADFDPDLVVVGSQGRSYVSRFFLGSISQKVLTEANCSVRVSRGRIEVDPAPVRLIIGFDGSPGSQAAVEAVASREWREQSEVRLIAIMDEIGPPDAGRFVPTSNKATTSVSESEKDWIESLANNAMVKLSSNNLTCSLDVLAGNPKDILVEEAVNWNADCIFVGANHVGRWIERFILGSTSSAVAARAHCSVEAVRWPHDAKQGNLSALA